MNAADSVSEVDETAVQRYATPNEPEYVTTSTQKDTSKMDDTSIMFGSLYGAATEGMLSLKTQVHTWFDDSREPKAEDTRGENEGRTESEGSKPAASEEREPTENDNPASKPKTWKEVSAQAREKSINYKKKTKPKPKGQSRGRSKSAIRNRGRVKSATRNRGKSKPRGRSRSVRGQQKKARSRSRHAYAMTKSQTKGRKSIKQTGSVKTKRRGNGHHAGEKIAVSSQKSCKTKQSNSDHDDASKATMASMSSKLITMWKRIRPEKGKKARPSGKRAAGASGKSRTPKQPNLNRTNRKVVKKTGKMKKTQGKKINKKPEDQIKDIGSGENERVINNPEALEEYAPPEASDDASWLGSFTEGFVQQFGANEPHQSMADLEDLSVQIERTQRYESANETGETGYFTPSNPSDSLTNSVSFKLSSIGDNGDTGSQGEDSLWTESMAGAYRSENGNTNEDWDEIVRSTDVVARLVEDGSIQRAPGRFHQDEEAMHAVSTIRSHADRLNMRERELYAAVRDDPSLLNGSTYYDSDGESLDSLDSIDYLFRPLDDRIDNLVDAFGCAPTGRESDRRRGRFVSAE